MKKILSFAVILCLSSNVFADTVSEIQRNIDSQYKDKLRQFEIDNRTTFIKERPELSVDPLSSREETGPKKYIRTIEIKNNDIAGISVSYLNRIIKPYENTQLTMKEVGDIQQKIQQYYFDKGYSSTRIYIDGNTMTGNVLTFVIIDGYIEELIFKRKSGRLYGKFAQSLQSFSFYPFAKGCLLNMKDLDQGLEQMNRLATSNASMEIVPGRESAYSVIEVMNDSKKRFTVSLSADNSGIESTGIYKSNLSVSSDNLLMLNDNITFTFSRNLDGGTSNQSSSNYFASLSIPFGHFTFMASSFNSGYKTPAGTQIGSYTSDGSTRNDNISLETVIKRGRMHKVSLGADISLKDTENNIDGQRLETSSKKLAVASGFLTAARTLDGGLLYGKFSYNKGLDSFDIERNSAIEGAPMAQFYSLGLYAQYSKYFKIPLIKLSTSYSAALNAQYSPDILYSSEQTTIGGLTSVRGFKEGSVSGDSGGYLRNELKWAVSNFTGVNGIFGIFRDTSINAFADYGYARHEAYAQDHQIAGAGAGISYRMKYFNASFSWSRCIYNVSSLPYEGDVLYFSAEARIQF